MAAVDTNGEAVASEEKLKVQAYIKEHNIGELMSMLVEGLLREKPGVKCKEHWAHMLRLDAEKENKEDPARALGFKASSSQVMSADLLHLFEVTRAITSEIVPKDTINVIISKTIELLGCDRVSLFVFDKRMNMLVLNASNLSVPIRVNPGQGIAGHTFKTRNIVNILDCYKDSRFDQTFDKMTGYKTNNLLTMPIIDFEDECMGVVQAINKLNKPAFTSVDEFLLESLTQHVSIALRNAEVYRTAIITSERANALLHMIQSLSQDLGAQSIILTISMHVNELVQADRCTVFLVDEGKQQLWSVSTDSGKEIRIPKSAGIAGECAMEGNAIVIDDCYQDARFNPAMDKKTGYHTQSMMCIPIVGRWRTGANNSVLAVIQMINKMEFDGEVGRFDEEDLQVMETFSTFVSPKLEGSKLLDLAGQHDTHKQSEAGKVFGEVPHHAGPLNATIEEGESSPGGGMVRRGSKNRSERRSYVGNDQAIMEEDEEEG
eukprot:gnl/TRDRNA2_/TRDRNA2_195938_c0_seq1.p1 gnl/TRDRNA2_/TRDRNA2_195938_c0~~gnl/TRDRNA2_/TRDRNA2_195938_c0_seq1.p1  ORF type:complete len:490 (+),score=110.11 gnl/TRDRNA2_/TRDRNA2_195938_c0_seq1:73-1542(+)